MDPETSTRQRTLNLGLICAGLWGVLLIVAPLFHNYTQLFEGLFTELGKALVVACVLGLVIDNALKKDLIRDAVSASIGYLLPEQLRNEMHWVYFQKVIAQQTYHLTLEHRPDQRTVIVRATVDRIIRNISNETTKVRIAGGIDNWFRPDSNAEITSAEYRRYKDNKYESAVKLHVKRVNVAVLYGIGDEQEDEEKNLVELRPDETIHLSFSYVLPCPDHGMEHLTYRYPIENPVVQVEVPETLRAHISMSHRGPYNIMDWEWGYLSSRLAGTLLPHQDIHVSWHCADEIRDARQSGTK